MCSNLNLGIIFQKKKKLKAFPKLCIMISEFKSLFVRMDHKKDLFVIL